MSFENLGLAEPLLRAIRAEGYQTPTGIQSAAIPAILAGKDVLGCAQTGTGKTAAFALPTLNHLLRPENRTRNRSIRSLVLSPTRELASQICDSFRTYGRHTQLRSTAIFGGVGQGAQERALKGGIDVLIATPGRLLDLMNQRLVQLAEVQVLILDEADRMLDMGFIHDLRRIVAQTPTRRQTLLFSATMPANVRAVAQAWLKDPIDVDVAPRVTSRPQIDQSIFMVEKHHKLDLLGRWLRETAWTRTLVFTRTKHGADKVAKHLTKAGIPADAMHGNKSQSQRQRALGRFKSPQPPVLVATDVAARGLDVDDVSHVINFDMPADPETYVHRIGRTGRSNATGVAITFCARDERSQLHGIERLLRQQLTIERSPAGLATATATEASDNRRNHRAAASHEKRGKGKHRLGGPHSRGRGGSEGAVSVPAEGPGRSRRRRYSRSL